MTSDIQEVPFDCSYWQDANKEYPMVQNLLVPPQLWGMEVPAVPFANHVSSQRLNMFTTNFPQALIVTGAEVPQVSSGYEREYLKYTFNTTRFEQPSVVLTAIPRYRINVGMKPIKYCPQYLVVYYGEEDKQVHCMWVSAYTQGTNGFGWENIINKNLLAPNTNIDKDVCIAHSRAVQGAKYCSGVNVNICYGTFKETIEDAICISESFAKKTIAKGYRSIVIDIHKDMLPLNKYGGDGDYKFMPDLGEYVGDDGVVCAFRHVDDLTYFADMTPSALRQYQPIHDDLFFQVDPGAQVVDIEVVKNPSKKVISPDYVFEQIEKYETETYAFYERILQVYQQECIQKHRVPGIEFNTLVTYAARYLGTIKKRVLGSSRKTVAKFKKKDGPIAFIQLKVMLKYDITPSLGSKYTGRYGNKGVISAIYKDEHMPINDYGVRADMLTSGMTIPNRMNVSQLYEVFTSCLADVVLKRMRVMDNWKDAYDMMIELFQDLNFEYAQLIDRTIFPNSEDKKKFTEEALRKDYLILVMPPFLQEVSSDWVLKLAKKYRIKSTPVEYNQLDANGKVLRRIRTKRNLFIGKQYMFMLCKVPFCKSSGLGFVNGWGVPITVKDSVTKSMTPISQTAIRLGEDENRNHVMNYGAVIAARILGIYANTPEATAVLADMLLCEKHPSRIQFIPRTNEFIQDHSRTIKAEQAIMNVCGIDLNNCIATEREMESIFKESPIVSLPPKRTRG